MGGDHKCPVCQATFTRPQHVARHMRSHTGDRPYKCQFCGDQFARSDLLARHVNKCHANEKPLLPPSGARRKGSASTSRATTSKQACDQCVQNSLPCDGCNPCSKCAQRKLRCTFVKFHRQTAPAGPGHHIHSPPDSLSSSLSLPGLSSSASSQSSLSSSSSRYPSGTRDDFHLNLMPLSVPSMADNLFADSGFMFPPSYAEGHAQPPSLPHHHTHGHGQQVQRPMTAGEPSDFSSRYRVRADLLRRTGEQVGLGASSSSSYPDIRGPAWGGSSASGAWDSHSRYAEEKMPDHRHSLHPHPYQQSGMSMDMGFRRSSTASRRSEFELDLGFSTDSSGSSVGSMRSQEQRLSSRMPSSASFHSSNYLPSSTSHNPSPSPSQQFQHPTSFSIPDLSSTLPPISQSPSTTIPPQPFDESAFGALSLEDPALLAPDAPPFFSSLPSSALESPHDPGLTPTPAREGQGEADGELWRAFMRNTPVGEVARRGSYPQYAHGGYHHSHTPQNQDRRSPPPQQEQDLTRYQAAVLAHARETQPVLRAPPRRATGDGNTHTHTHTSTSTRLLSAHGIVGEHSRPGSAESSASESARSSVSESASSVGSGVGEARMGGFGVGSHGRMGGERGGEGTPMKVGVKRGLARVVGGEDLVLGGPEMKRRGTVGEGGVTP